MKNNSTACHIPSLEKFFTSNVSVTEQPPALESLPPKTSHNNCLRLVNSINICSGPCGSGKTYALCRFIKEQEDAHNHLIVMPSLLLATQVKKDLKDSGFGLVDLITSETIVVSTTVRSEIIKFLDSCMDSGHALLVAWQSYDDLPYFKNQSHWKIYIDELPQVNSFYSVDISKNRQLITDFIELDQVINSEIASISIKDGCGNKLQQAHDSTDDGYNEFRSLYRAVLSDNRDVFVLIEDWNVVINKYKSDIKTGELTFIAMLNPREFKNTTLLAANIENSLIYHWFKRYHKVNFTPNMSLVSNLRYTQHDETVGNRVEIYYCIEERNYSKYYRDTVENDDITIGQQMDNIAVEFFNDEDFLYVVNIDYNNSVLNDSEQAHKLPVRSHGINHYQHFDAIYFNLALNFSPKQLQLLEALGFTRSDILIAITYETIYQCIMRTSLRNPDSNRTVRIIVPDDSTALYMSDLLGGARLVDKLEGINSTSKLPKLTASERNNRSKCSTLKRRLTGTSSETSALNRAGLPPNDSDNQSLQKLLRLYPYIDESNQKCKLANMSKLQVAITLHNYRYDQLENQFSDYIFNTKDFIKFLAQFAKDVVTSKDEVLMINSAVFDDSIDTDGYRRQVNFIQSNMMILDFDDGELSPEQFENIFWHKTNKIQRRSFIICNSYSRSKEQPNRFRVFMFYKQPVRSIEQHKAVLQDITNTLKKNGFDGGHSGLDNACKNGIQSFYLPCTNRSQKEHAFFRKHGISRVTDINRHGIDVNLIIKTQTSANDSEYEPLSFDSFDNDKEQAIAAIIQSVKSMTENRHTPFFNAAIKLRGLGLSLPEIQRHCNEIAGNDERMRNKVPSIMASLRNYQR